MKKYVCLFFIISVLISVSGCSSNKLFDQAISFIEMEDFDSLKEPYEFFQKKNNEAFQKLDNALKNKIKDITDNAIESKAYKEAFEKLSRLEDLYPSLDLFLTEKTILLKDAFRSMIQKVYEDSLADGSYENSIMSLNDFLDVISSENSYISNYISLLSELKPNEQIYLSANDKYIDGMYSEALEDFMLVETYSDYYYPLAQQKIIEIINIIYDNYVDMAKEYIKENNLKNLSTLTQELARYSLEKSKQLESNVEELFKSAIDEMKNSGQYNEVLIILKDSKTSLPFLLAYIDEEISKVTSLLPNIAIYDKGLNLLNNEQYAESLGQFNSISPNAVYYYNLAAEKKNLALDRLNLKYVDMSKESFDQKKIDQALSYIELALSYKNTIEAVNLKAKYLNEKSKYMNASEIYNRYASSVVSIIVFDEDGQKMGFGTGFVISADGKIITNYHVVGTAYTVKVKFENGEEFDVKKVYSYNKERDYIVLQIEKTGLSPLVLGKSDEMINGESIVTIGNPKGLENTISEGIISKMNRQIENENLLYMQISAAISPGSSGGPVFNMKGEVIGITTAYIVDGQNLNLAVPIDDIVPSLNKTDSMTFNQFADMLVFEIIEYYSGSRFEGYTRRGIPNGHGKFIFGEGYYYEGNFENGEFSGNGSLYFKSGSKYIGEFKQSEFNGRGILYLNNGAQIEGEWRDGSYIGSTSAPQNVDFNPTNQSTSISLKWDKGDFSYYHVYYSYDLKIWSPVTDIDGQKKKFAYSPSYQLIDGFKTESFVYVAVTGVKNNTETHRSGYAAAWTKFNSLNVYSNDGKNIFLGKILPNETNPESIINQQSEYGSTKGVNSIWNRNSVYGSLNSNFSAFNENAEKPPVIKNSKGEVIGYISVNIKFADNPEYLFVDPSWFSLYILASALL